MRRRPQGLTVDALKVERIDTRVRGVDGDVLPFHRLVQQKNPIGLTDVVVIIHFVVL